MRIYVTLFFICIVASSIAQKVRGREIDSIIKIDSLFLYDERPPFIYESIKIIDNDMIIKHRVTVFDSTLRIQNKFKVVIDTISFNCLNNPSILSPLLEKYDKKNDESINTFIHFVELIKNNNLTSIEPAGHGDCAWCSTYLFFDNRTAIVILNKNDYCFPYECFLRPENARQRKIKKNIYVLHNL